jgi:hypothetical protein
MTNWTEELSEEQKQYVMDLIITTVKEIREQIAQDIEGTKQIWKSKGFVKSRRTSKAFDMCALLARGKHEIVTRIEKEEEPLQTESDSV